jgi:ribosomal protein S18 acetylase RimI-like enzyme
VTRVRRYRNGDPPALADLWNRATPARHVVRPLRPHEFDALVAAKLGFEAEGLLVAELEGRVVGFAHAGFGPAEPHGPSHRLDRSLGTIAMLVVEPGLATGDEVADRLVAGCADYLRRRGAAVLYAGGQYPLNPFYWGLYGDSEFAGILSGHAAFRGAVERAGFTPAAEVELLDADLEAPEPRDPRLVLARRHFSVEIDEDARLPGWWDALALGLFHPTHFLVADRTSGAAVAEAWTWDIAAGMAVDDGISRTGLIGVEVRPEHRRRGLGRLLVSECLRHAKGQLADRLCVQTATTNAPALGLYRALGFRTVESATLYRAP